MKSRQWPIIYGLLYDQGEISRNQCLSRYISRLSARIANLEELGWKFTPEHRGGDYVYVVGVYGKCHLNDELPERKQLTLV